MPYVKNSIKVKVPQRSGFDKSFRNTGTFKCGTLTPILCDEVIPGSRLSLKLNLAAQLPPLVSDTYMNLRLKCEAFFVPSRLCCASFEDFFCDFPRRVYTNYSASDSTVQGAFSDVTAAIPTLRLFDDTPASLYEPGSLLDFLGFKSDSFYNGGSPVSLKSIVNLMPLVAYHLVWQEWYRNPRVQNPAFAQNLGTLSVQTSNSHITSSQRVPSLPYNYYHRAFVGDGNVTLADNSSFDIHATNVGDFVCADGVSLFALRQRNFPIDGFTGARVSPQQGQPMALDITIPSGTDAAGGATSFTIAQLRAANSLQQFRERNNLPSPRLVDQVKARYGANLSDGVAQRPICIGRASYDVTSSGISQTAPADGTGVTGNNPFDGVAAQYGRGYGAGSDFIIEDFTANEPGYIIVLMSLVPEVTYSSGILPYLRRYRSDGSITDMACSLLQNVGDQPIYQDEVIANPGNYAVVFGYQDRYWDWMYHPNEAHGEMRDGNTLASFVLQRSFNSASLNTAFLEIPTNYLDGVMALSTASQGFSAWYDCLLEYKVSMPLAEFSIPSLQDPAYEHGHTVVLNRNGQIF